MDFDDLDIAAQSSLQDLKKEIQLADPATLRLLMTQARTFNAWQDKAVSGETLEEVYQIMKMGPTSANCCPARLVFLVSKVPSPHSLHLPQLTSQREDAE